MEVHPMQPQLRGTRFITAIFLFVIAVFTIDGCGGRLFTYKGYKVTQADFLIRLKDGNDQGKWKTNEIAITYQYQMTPETMKIDGDIELVGGFAIGFNYMSHLAVNLLFVDNQGIVVENVLIYSGENNLSIPVPMRFAIAIPVPEGAHTISFTYDGELADMNYKDTTSYRIGFFPS